MPQYLEAFTMPVSVSIGGGAGFKALVGSVFRLRQPASGRCGCGMGAERGPGGGANRFAAGPVDCERGAVEIYSKSVQLVIQPVVL